MENVNGSDTVPAVPKFDWPDDYWTSLVKFARVETEEPPLGMFGTLQTTNITHLLNEIATIKSSMQEHQTISPEQLERLRVVLHQYADAVRDYKFLKELQRQPIRKANDKRLSLGFAFAGIDRPYDGDNYPYHTEYLTVQAEQNPQRDPLREVLRMKLPKQFTWPESELAYSGRAYANNEAPNGYSPFVDVTARFIVGMFGGCAVIVPMIIMIFRPSVGKSVAVVCVSLFLFALISGFVFATNNKETILATAAYAAVLVVFIGTSDDD